MKIKAVKSVGVMPVYDLSIDSTDYDQQHYILENGVVSHNTGIYYSANTIWIIGRRQTKTGTEVTGYDFVVNVEKSRFVKEKSKIPISVSWEGGIEKYSGLLEVAMESGHVVKPKNGWYAPVNQVTGEIGGNKRLKEIMNYEFWNPILEDAKFQKFVEGQYTIGAAAVWSDEFIAEMEE